jgi:hypothetical protein
LLGSHERGLNDALRQLDDKGLTESERWATVHKSWADLRKQGKSGRLEEVIEEIQVHWKPERTEAFSAENIRKTYGLLKLNGYLR